MLAFIYSLFVSVAMAQNLCADGWYSSSSGSGTCSHHGGILGNDTTPYLPYIPYLPPRTSPLDYLAPKPIYTNTDNQVEDTNNLSVNYRGLIGSYECNGLTVNSNKVHCWVIYEGNMIHTRMSCVEPVSNCLNTSGKTPSQNILQATTQAWRKLTEKESPQAVEHNNTIQFSNIQPIFTVKSSGLDLYGNGMGWLVARDQAYYGYLTCKETLNRCLLKDTTGNYIPIEPQILELISTSDNIPSQNVLQDTAEEWLKMAQTESPQIFEPKLTISRIYPDYVSDSVLTHWIVRRSGYNYATLVCKEFSKECRLQNLDGEYIPIEPRILELIDTTAY